MRVKDIDVHPKRGDRLLDDVRGLLRGDPEVVERRAVHLLEAVGPGDRVERVPGLAVYGR